MRKRQLTVLCSVNANGAVSFSVCTYSPCLFRAACVLSPWNVTSTETGSSSLTRLVVMLGGLGFFGVVLDGFDFGLGLGSVTGSGSGSFWVFGFFATSAG